MEIKIYTDGACVGNPGPGGWAAVVISEKNVKNIDLWKKLKELVLKNEIEWHWIKGHSENPMNDLADKLAKEATPI